MTQTKCQSMCRLGPAVLLGWSMHFAYNARICSFFRLCLPLAPLAAPFLDCCFGIKDVAFSHPFAAVYRFEVAQLVRPGCTEMMAQLRTSGKHAYVRVGHRAARLSVAAAGLARGGIDGAHLSLCVWACNACKCVTNCTSVALHLHGLRAGY